MSISEVKVPDIGEFQDVEVVEVICKEGQSVAVEDPLITLESDKATMDVPSPLSGRILSIKIKAGDKVSEGNLILELETNAKSEPEKQNLIQVEDQSSKIKDSTSIDANISNDLSAVADISCEVLVLGSGPGGYTAAFRAAEAVFIDKMKR